MRALYFFSLCWLYIFSPSIPPAWAVDIRVKEGFGGSPPLRAGFFEEFLPAARLQEYLEHMTSHEECVQPLDCGEPLPLVAYVFLDSPDESHQKMTFKKFPVYLGYLALVERGEQAHYAWTAKAPGEGAHCLLHVSSAKQDELPSFLVYYGDPLRCEFSPGATCASFFLWMKGHSLFFPVYRVFFTAGLPPDDAWVPEFDTSVPISVTANATRTDNPANRPRLKNPLPGMRPAPWYPPGASR